MQESEKENANAIKLGNINKLKIEIFDILRQQEILQNMKMQKLQEIQALEVNL